MNKMTYADEWVEAINQILTDARKLLGLDLPERDFPGGREPKPCPAAKPDQMLLPGIAGPRRWEFGSAARGHSGCVEC